MKAIYNLALLFTLLFLSIEPVYSQKDSITTDDYYIDFAVPDLGAFTLLNTKPDNITTPGNTKEFAASLLNVVSGGSKISPGLAIDWAPVRTFCKVSTPNEYKKSYLLRDLQLTFGSIADSLGTKVGAGIRWTIIDKTDPLMDDNFATRLLNIRQESFKDLPKDKILFNNRVDRFLSKILKDRGFKDDYITKLNALFFNMEDTNVVKREVVINFKMANDSINELIKMHYPNDDKALSNDEEDKLMNFCIQFKNLFNSKEQFNADINAALEKEKRKWLNDHWNATVVSFGAGWVWNSIDAKWSTLSTQLFKTYINGKFKISRKSQVIGMLSCGIPHNISTTDSSITSQLFLGGRYLVGNSSNRFSIDLGYSKNFAKSSSFNSQVLITDIGVEFKLDDGIFLEIAGGFKGEPSSFIKSSNILLLGSLKYTLRPKNRFDLPE